jgi:hypothetical protein
MKTIEDQKPPERNPTVVRFIKAGSVLGSLLALVVVIDMLLPRQLSVDQLLKKEADHYYTGTRPGYISQEHDIYFRTTRFRFKVDMHVFNAFTEGDTIPILHTPIFNKPMQISFEEDGTAGTWRVGASWYAWCIALIAFTVFSSSVNLRKGYDPDTAFKAGIAAIVFAVVLLVMFYA